MSKPHYDACEIIRIDFAVQCVLADKDVMLVVEPGTHGSTYGGNPLGCAVSLRALELIEEEDLTARAEKLGNIFRDSISSLNSPIVQKVRGKGLLNAVVIDESAANGRTAWDLCILLKEKGVLVSPTPISADFSIVAYTAFSVCFHRLSCRYRCNPWPSHLHELLDRLGQLITCGD